MATGFNAVSMGNGELFFDGRNVGILKGDVTYSYEYDIEDLYAGVPQKLKGRITRRVSASLKASTAELNMENVAMALGGLTISNVGGGTTAHVKKSYTVSARGSSTILSVMLDESPIDDGATFTVYKADGTTVIAATEYFVDYGSGFVYFKPGTSDVTEGAVVKVSYTDEQPASKQVNLGATFSLAQKNLEFVHTSPVTGKEKRVVMWLASSDGRVNLNFSETNIIVNEVTFMAIEDTSHPNNPLGYFAEVQ